MVRRCVWGVASPRPAWRGWNCLGGLERGALAANLLHEDSLDDLGFRVGRRVDVGHHRDARLHDGGVGQRLLQLLGLPRSTTAPPQPPSDSPPTPSPYPGPASRRLAASGHLAAASGYPACQAAGGADSGAAGKNLAAGARTAGAMKSVWKAPATLRRTVMRALNSGLAMASTASQAWRTATAQHAHSPDWWLLFVMFFSHF